MKPKSRLEPRTIHDTIGRNAWYYLNSGSVDVIVEHRNARGEYVATAQVRLSRRRLLTMLEELAGRV